ncbi:MAG: ATP-binding cassette domain-containing protein [Opitutales bacterium]|nr:ATP-binding cassette domain-containing protein [Opitutales bacterium]
MPLLAIRELTHAFGSAALFENAQFSIEPKERVCLIGRNGEGKSTLLKIVEGLFPPDKGQFERAPNLRIATLPQEVPEKLEGSVYEIVAQGAGDAAFQLMQYHQESLRLEDPGADTDAVLVRMSELQHALEANGGWELERKVEELLTKLSLDSELAFNSLSGGMKRRVLLASALMSEPTLLLLDEPTNHLDFASISWLEEFLPTRNIALLFITHDRAFLRNIATRILELDRGKLTSFDCNYDTYLQRKDELLLAEEQQNAVFDKKLAQEEQWIRRGIKARRTRNEGRVRALKDMRLQRSQRRDVRDGPAFGLQEGNVSGRKVLTIKGLTYSWAHMKIAADFSTTVWRGDKIGVIGPNGSGKTTLLKLLLGELPPHSGEVIPGTNLEVAYFDQHRSQLNPKMTLKQAVSDDNEYVMTAGGKKHIYSYLEEFLFPADRAQSLVSSLSGGERNRLMLARLFTRQANVLVLDEPTNDLDIETLELLEDLLVEYSGTLLLVSHDREFLDRVCTHTFALEQGGVIKETVGGYAEYFRDKALEAKPSTAAATKATPSKKTWKPEKPRVITNKEQAELDQVPKLIEQLEQQQAVLIEQMSQPDFSVQGAGAIEKTQQQLNEIEAKLEVLFVRWEELEALPKKN